LKCAARKHNSYEENQEDECTTESSEKHEPSILETRAPSLSIFVATEPIYVAKNSSGRGKLLLSKYFLLYVCSLERERERERERESGEILCA
jgi:hypothetical protein